MTDCQSTHAPGCWGWGPKHSEGRERAVESCTGGNLCGCSISFEG